MTLRFTLPKPSAQKKRARDEFLNKEQREDFLVQGLTFR
jgi:hypothetical protein